MTERRAGTARSAIKPAAVRLIERHGEALMATAHRYTLTPEDAEDAYQRALEILLTRAPAVPESELVPWMRTVVKHEAFAIWRSRSRPAASDDDALERTPSRAPTPDEHAESYERLRQGAEAIGRLKPQEVRCLLLRAEGYSYRQICELTGWTYTKVNRCLTEGRRSFLQRVAGIESGAECDRLAPLLSALADGEATAAEMATLRPHLRSCLACRATLRAFREVPHRAAEVVAPVATGAAAGEEGPAALERWLETAIHWLGDRATIAGAKVQAAAEASSASKAAAVAASTVALAGGTVAVTSLGGGQPAGDPDPAPVHAGPSPQPGATLPEPPAVPVVAEAAAAVAGPPPPAAAAPGPVISTPAPSAPPPAVAAPPPQPDRPRFMLIAKPIPNLGQSALPGVDEDERTVDPLTEPEPPPTRTSGPAPPQQQVSSDP